MVVWGVSCPDVPRTCRPAVVDSAPEAVGTSRVPGVWHESPGGVSGYVEVMAPIQLGDELRAALVSRQGAGVLCLHRTDRPSGFTGDEVALVGRLASHIAEGLRRALLVAPYH